MFVLPVTLTAVAAAAIINVWLMIRVGQVRNTQKVFVGDGGSEPVVRRMRAHSNFVENTPFVLLLIAAIEISGRGQPWLAYVAGVYMLARVAHGVGMDGGSLGKGRMIGTIVSMLTLIGLAVAAVLVVMGTL